MLVDRWIARGLWLAAAALPLVALPAQADEKQKPDEPKSEQPRHQRGEENPRVRSPLVAMSDYWLGLDCRPVAPELQDQLDLPKDQGLLIERVLPESPADKTGLKRHDVLLEADGKPLRQVEDLVDKVADAKDKQFALTVVHGGKKSTVRVTAEKRPENQRFPGGPMNEEVERSLRQLREQFGRGGEPWRMHLFGPGMVMHAPPPRPFPKDMSVTIKKKGDEPASIEVQQGSESWKATEDKLADLPEKVRGPVEDLLGRRPPMFPQNHAHGGEGGEGRGFHGPPHHGPPGPPPRPRDDDRGAGGRPEDRFEQQLEDLSRRMEELREQLRERRKPPRAEGNPDRTSLEGLGSLIRLAAFRPDNDDDDDKSDRGKKSDSDRRDSDKREKDKADKDKGDKDKGDKKASSDDDHRKPSGEEHHHGHHGWHLGHFGHGGFGHGSFGHHGGPPRGSSHDDDHGDHHGPPHHGPSHFAHHGWSGSHHGWHGSPWSHFAGRGEHGDRDDHRCPMCEGKDGHHGGPPHHGSFGRGFGYGHFGHGGFGHGSFGHHGGPPHHGPPHFAHHDRDHGDHHGPPQGPPHHGDHGDHHGPPHHGPPHFAHHFGPPHHGPGDHGDHHGPAHHGDRGDHHGPPHFAHHSWSGSHHGWHGSPWSHFSGHHGDHHGPPHHGDHGDHHGPSRFSSHHGDHHGSCPHCESGGYRVQWHISPFRSHDRDGSDADRRDDRRRHDADRDDDDDDDDDDDRGDRPRHFHFGPPGHHGPPGGFHRPQVDVREPRDDSDRFAHGPDMPPI